MLYEFECKKCGKITEQLVKLGTIKIKCPACGTPAEKIISVPNFVVHGFSAKNLYSRISSSSKKTTTPKE
jgi:putative FmdB family regulatory protein